MRTAPAILVLTMGCVACADAPVAPPDQVQVPRLAVSDAPDWTGATADDFPVARVGEAGIPASRLARALAYEPDRDPRAVLDALIDREVAAQAALRAPEAPADPEADRREWERALVATLLDDRFMSGYREQDIPMDHLIALFSQPPIWARFNHARMYDVQDYQWTCCDGRPATCDQPYAQACFAEGQAAMGRAYDAILRERPDGDDLPFLVERYQAAAPRLAYQEYTFAYDEEKRIQRGRILIDDEVVQTVVRTPVGQFAPPVRSRFGWHVIYVRDTVAPERRDLDDPAVRSEIATTFRAGLQQMAFLEFMASLVGTDRLTVLKVYFQQRPAPAGKPRYDIEVYLDSLRDAVEGAAAAQDKEPL